MQKCKIRQFQAFRNSIQRILDNLFKKTSDVHMLNYKQFLQNLKTSIISSIQELLEEGSVKSNIKIESIYGNTNTAVVEIEILK